MSDPASPVAPSPAAAQPTELPTPTHLRCTVESLNYSACGMQVGDHFDVVDGNLSLPTGRPFCYFALANVIPLLSGRLDTPAGEDWLATEPLLACPDPPEGVLMRLTRVPPAEC